MARFQPGVSGNPSGRRKSPRQAVQALLAPHVEQLAEQALAKALQGDVGATVAVLDLYRATLPARPTSST